jgi:hypothetical protein
MMTPDHDFPPKAHPVHYFYGMSLFMVVTIRIPNIRILGFYDYLVLSAHGREDVDNASREKVGYEEV